MMSASPSQYLFYLCCCYQPDCIHPICRAEKPQERLWYSNGSPLSFLPLPTRDPARPYGNTACQECKGFWKELAKNGDVVPSNKPPSQAIADAFKQRKGIPCEAEVSELEAQVLLHPDEVQMWLKHLQSVSENRKEEARKAVQKRRKAC